MTLGHSLRRIITLLALAYPMMSLFAQDAAELDRRNGFKSIKLAYPIDSVKGAVFKKDFMEKDEFAAKLYETEDPAYQTIGEVAVKKVKLMTYKNRIYKIIVNVDKDPRVMVALEKAYGKATYVVRTSSYNWKSQLLSLTFVAQSRSIELVYRSYPVLSQMLEDKGKKVDKISEDF